MYKTSQDVRHEKAYYVFMTKCCLSQSVVVFIKADVCCYEFDFVSVKPHTHELSVCLHKNKMQLFHLVLW